MIYKHYLIKTIIQPKAHLSILCIDSTGCPTNIGKFSFKDGKHFADFAGHPVVRQYTHYEGSEETIEQKNIQN